MASLGRVKADGASRLKFSAFKGMASPEEFHRPEQVEKQLQLNNNLPIEYRVL